MNAITLLIQAFFDHQARQQAEKLREAGLRAAEKGRRVALAGAFFTVSGIFFFVGLLIAVIELGLQIDRQNGIWYSGLMVSATIFLGLCLLVATIGWLVAREPSSDSATEGRKAPSEPAESPGPGSEIRNLVEQIAVLFLKDFLETQKAAKAQNAQAHERSTEEP
ncbi:MAG: hypothetical protein RBT63_10360 [Bdellovibrionales bacterium]|jgi:hypothetical protein|nr:hypothetical protein [Bdellovibrionales bacterium]